MSSWRNIVLCIIVTAVLEVCQGAEDVALPIGIGMLPPYELYNQPPAAASALREQLQVAPFLWGTATAAYQIEGAAHEDGRGPSIWDTFSHTANKVANSDTGDVADDNYHLFLQDTELLHDLGVNAYRFSVSWSRILPEGRGQINQKAIEHYNEVINSLVKRGIEPLITLYHWDLPQGLEDAYGGLLNGEQFEKDFVFFADICFRSFGDRVKKWITINEPWTVSFMGYGPGVFAPGRCSDRRKCPEGHSETESYIAAHSLLNAHAAAVQLYRARYQAEQQGVIGITLNQDWAEPWNRSNIYDVVAAQRRNEFQLAWFADPIFFGRYPQSMVDLVGDRLPTFTAAQKARLQDSVDFLGMNHYSTKYYLYRHRAAGHRCHVDLAGSSYSESYPSFLNVTAIEPDFAMGGWADDQCNYETKFDINGDIVGPQGESAWLNHVPWGFYKMLRWVGERYHGFQPLIYITENGCDVAGESALQLPEVLHDEFRIQYYKEYIEQMQKAIHDGVNIKGYFAWSLLDNFEWVDGYEKRFGLHYVDFQDPQRARYAKDSAKWYAAWIQQQMNHQDNLLPGKPIDKEDKKDEDHKEAAGDVDDSNKVKKAKKQHKRSSRKAGEVYELKVMTECQRADSACSWLDYLYAAISHMISNSYAVHNHYYEDM